MMQVACNRPIMLPSAMSKGNRTIINPRLFCLGEGQLSLFGLRIDPGV